MANIPVLTGESAQFGTALAPPFATIDVWQSLDPTIPFSMQNWGISNFQGVHNQIGLYNGLGNWCQLGLANLLGFGADVGGHVDAQPGLSSAAIKMSFSSPNIIETTPLDSRKLFENGTSVCTAPCSDINAKKNIVPLENSLDKVLNLKSVSFDWDENVVPNKSSHESRQIGLIAQEVEKVVPEVVRNEFIENQTLKSVRYENLVALLIEGMKEQQEQINSLKETVQELSTKLAECCQA